MKGFVSILYFICLLVMIIIGVKRMCSDVEHMHSCFCEITVDFHCFLDFSIFVSNIWYFDHKITSQNSKNRCILKAESTLHVKYTFKRVYWKLADTQCYFKSLLNENDWGNLFIIYLRGLHVNNHIHDKMYFQTAFKATIEPNVKTFLRRR